MNILYTKFWLVGLTEFQNSEAICANFLMERRELKHKRERRFENVHFLWFIRSFIRRYLFLWYVKINFKEKNNENNHS